MNADAFILRTSAHADTLWLSVDGEHVWAEMHHTDSFGNHYCPTG